MDKLRKNILSNVFRIRMKRGKTQLEVARAIGISRSLYGKIEQGRVDLRAVVLMKLAQYYGICSDYFVDQGPDWEDKSGCPQKELEALRAQISQLEHINKLYGKWNRYLEDMLTEKERQSLQTSIGRNRAK